MPHPTSRPQHRECDSGHRSRNCYGFQRNCGACRGTKCHHDGRGDVPYTATLGSRRRGPGETSSKDLCTAGGAIGRPAARRPRLYVYQHGLNVAKRLKEDADELGRKRHPDDSAGTVGPISRRASTGPAEPAAAASSTAASPASRRASTGPVVAKRRHGGSKTATAIQALTSRSVPSNAAPAVSAARRRSAKG